MTILTARTRLSANWLSLYYWPSIASIPEGIRRPDKPGTTKKPNRIFAVAAALATLALLLFKLLPLITGSHNGPHTTKRLSRCDSIKIYRNGIPPGVDQASVTLANGSQLLLDSSFNYLGITQGNSYLRRLKTGEFQYTHIPGKAPDRVFYNTITTSRGTQCVVLLPDGSSVRLNAASSIRFPLHFTGEAREVTISGEVFFDIKKAGTPFFATIDNTTRLEVTGTSFNVNAYGSEIATTLVSGRLTIKKGGDRTLLKPGEEAILPLHYEPGKAPTVTVRKANIDQAIAWKNGFLIFENEPMQDALKEIARWYGLELINPEKIPFYFHLTQVICRGTTLPELVQLLRSQGLKFRVEDRKLIF